MLSMEVPTSATEDCIRFDDTFIVLILLLLTCVFALASNATEEQYVCCMAEKALRGFFLWLGVIFCTAFIIHRSNYAPRHDNNILRQHHSYTHHATTTAAAHPSNIHFMELSSYFLSFNFQPEQNGKLIFIETCFKPKSRQRSKRILASPKQKKRMMHKTLTKYTY
jgi:hypothetical protein